MFSVEKGGSDCTTSSLQASSPTHLVSGKTELEAIRGYRTLSWSGEHRFTSCSPPVTLASSRSVVQLSALVGEAAEISQKGPGGAGLRWEREVLLGRRQQAAHGRPGPSWRNL